MVLEPALLAAAGRLNSKDSGYIPTSLNQNFAGGGEGKAAAENLEFKLAPWVILIYIGV